MFGKVYLINLEKRKDRIEAFRLQQDINGWQLPEPEIFKAIEGDRVGVPNYFTQGGGAWGCLRSHSTCLERCIMDGTPSVLMLEDDVTWMQDSWDRLAEFMKRVPDDWDQLMLGGQHIRQPKPHSDGVARVMNTQRTHAYAIRGAAMKSLLNLWYTSSVHIDWAMGDWQKNWKVYCPDEFIFGQAGGKSDISGQVNGAKFWNAPDLAPIVHLSCPLEVMQRLRGNGLHTGYTRDEHDIDAGLNDVVRSRNRAGQLSRWLDTLAWEAASMENTYVAVYHPQITFEEVRAIHKGDTIEVKGDTVEECLSQMSSLELKASRNHTHIAVIRASRDVVESLSGFHRGFWIDDVSGYDQGIRLAAASADRTGRIRDWLKAVAPEAEKMGCVPCIWHPDITLDDVKKACPERKVVEIVGTTRAEVMHQWRRSGLMEEWRGCPATA